MPLENLFCYVHVRMPDPFRCPGISLVHSCKPILCKCPFSAATVTWRLQEGLEHLSLVSSFETELMDTIPIPCLNPR